jgi:hypothetical protein
VKLDCLETKKEKKSFKKIWLHHRISIGELPFHRYHVQVARPTHSLPLLVVLPDLYRES